MSSCWGGSRGVFRSTFRNNAWPMIFSWWPATCDLRPVTRVSSSGRPPLYALSIMRMVRWGWGWGGSSTAVEWSWPRSSGWDLYYFYHGELSPHQKFRLGSQYPGNNPTRNPYCAPSDFFTSWAIRPPQIKKQAPWPHTGNYNVQYEQKEGKMLSFKKRMRNSVLLFCRIPPISWKSTTRL